MWWWWVSAWEGALLGRQQHHNNNNVPLRSALAILQVLVGEADTWSSHGPSQWSLQPVMKECHYCRVGVETRSCSRRRRESFEGVDGAGDKKDGRLRAIGRAMPRCRAFVGTGPKGKVYNGAAESGHGLTGVLVGSPHTKESGKAKRLAPRRRCAGSVWVALALAGGQHDEHGRGRTVGRTLLRTDYCQ
jgi:hypothetical protein